MTLSRRQLIGLAAAGGVVGFPIVADLTGISRAHRDPYSWNTESIQAASLPMTQVIHFNEFEVDGWGIHDISAGPSQDLVILLSKGNWNLEGDPNRLRHPWKDRRHFGDDVQRSYQIVHQQRDGSRRTIAIHKPIQDYWWAQPIHKEGYLLIRGLARSGSTKYDADVHDFDGRFVRSFAIGNDVELVQATLSGNVWVGYGDDGAYGDNPLSQTGVVCFDQNGKVNFRFNKLANQEQALKIEHTYAMNVISDNEAWLYYYTQPPEDLASLYSDTEFALARVRNQEVDKVWRDITNRAPVRGEHAVAVHDHRLLFGGKSLVDQSSIYLVSLSDDSFQRYIAAADGEPIESWLGFARGSWLYLWTDNALYGIDASTLPPLD